MTDVKALSRGIGELYEGEILRKREVLLCCEGLLLVPFLLPFFFDFLIVVIHFLFLCIVDFKFGVNQRDNRRNILFGSCGHQSIQIIKLS